MLKGPIETSLGSSGATILQTMVLFRRDSSFPTGTRFLPDR